MSTRELRSSAKRKRGTDSAAILSDPEAPAKRQKKDLLTRYECYSCGENRTEKQFPDYNPSAECEHSIHTCSACLRMWVDIQIESNQTTLGGEDGKTVGIACPECPSLMRAVSIQIATTKKMYVQFDKLERKHIGDTAPGWRWCLSPHCNADQVHKTVQKKGKDDDDEGNSYDTAVDLDTYEPAAEVVELLGDPRVCTCHVCGTRACVPCDRPDHVVETCKAFQLRVKGRIDEEDKALRAIIRATKPCPKCQVRIQKNGGCPHMYCKWKLKDWCGRLS
jgi:hypothetical protein